MDRMDAMDVNTSSLREDKENVPVNRKRAYPFTEPPLLRSSSSESGRMSFSRSFDETSAKGIVCEQTPGKLPLQGIAIHPSVDNATILPSCSAEKTTSEFNPISNSYGSPLQVIMKTRSRRLPSTSSESNSSHAAAGGGNLDVDQHCEAEEEVST
ncbi:SHC SH2 domain-binding protein 1-like protein A, partial [Frankliniella fusca]